MVVYVYKFKKEYDKLLSREVEGLGPMTPGNLCAA
jgi:hypothetical protein